MLNYLDNVYSIILKIKNFKKQQVILLLLLIAFLIRIIIFQLGFAPSFPDAISYFEAGQNLFNKGEIENDLAMPVYPILSFLTGGENWLIYLDILFSVFTVWNIYFLAEHLFNNRWVSLLASGIASIYPFFIFYSISRLSETTFIYFLTLSFLMYYRRIFVWGHIFMVTTVLIRPALDLYAPVVILIFALVVHRNSLKKSMLRLTGYACLYLVLMTPWWLHNYAKYGEYVRLNLGYGVVLYAGNNSMNRSGGGITGIDYSTKIVEGVNDPLLRNKIYFDAGLNYIKENPKIFIFNSWVKFQRFWRLWPYAQDWGSPKIIIISILSYGAVLFFSIVSFFYLTRAQLRMVTPILILICYLSSVHMITIGSIRYRLPIEPFLIIFASFGVFMVVRSVVKRHVKDEC